MGALDRPQMGETMALLPARTHDLKRYTNSQKKEQSPNGPPYVGVIQWKEPVNLEDCIRSFLGGVRN